MNKLDATYYIDQHYMFSKKENVKDGIRDFYLSGYYYLAIELLKRKNYPVSQYPYSDMHYFERAFNIYKANPQPCDLNSAAAVSGLLRSNKYPYPEFAKQEGLWSYYFSSKSLIYSILLYFYDIVFGIALLSKKQITMQDIVYFLYRRGQGLNPIMWFVSKFVNHRNLKKTVKSYFNVRHNMPPFDELYVKLIDLYC